MNVIHDGDDLKYLATRADKRMLFIDSDGFLFDSVYNVNEVNLSQDARDKLSKSGEFRQVFFNLHAFSDYLNDKANEQDLKEMNRLLLPLIIELWKEDKLDFCEPLP